MMYEKLLPESGWKEGLEEHYKYDKPRGKGLEAILL